MKQSICISCKSTWNGVMSVAKREGTVYVVFSSVKLSNYTYILGLYCSLVFTCHCSNEIRINTSKQCPKTSKRDINVRSVIGSYSCFFENEKAKKAAPSSKRFHIAKDR